MSKSVKPRRKPAKKAKKSKHIPVRQCIKCRVRMPKVELIRIRGGQEGGKGAYVCKSCKGK